MATQTVQTAADLAASAQAAGQALQMGAPQAANASGAMGGSFPSAMGPAAGQTAATSPAGAAASAKAAGTGAVAAAGAAKGAMAAAAPAAGLLAKLGIGGALTGSGAAKATLGALASPVMAGVVIAGAVYGVSGRKKREEPPMPEPEPPKRTKKKGWNMGKLIAAKGALGLLALVSLFVAGAGVLIGYKYLHTETVTIAAGPGRGESFVMMSAVKTVVEKQYPRLKVKIGETSGTMDSLEQMNRGTAAMAAVEADIPSGDRSKAVAVLYEDVYQLLANTTPAPEAAGADGGPAAETPAEPAAKPEDAPAAAVAGAKTVKGKAKAPASAATKQFADLKGAKIAVPAQSGPYKAFLFLAAHYGLKENSFVFRGGDDANAVEVFGHKDADALFQIRSIHNPTIAKLAAKGGVALIPIDQGNAIHAEAPGDVAAVIPKGAYIGHPPFPAMDTPSIATQRLLLARDDADEDAVHAITKVLMENRRELANAVSDSDESVRALFGEVKQPPTRVGLAAAIHPGALAYYDHNKTSFLAAHSDTLAFAVIAFALIWLWIAELRRTRGESKKELADTYNQKMLTLMEEAKSAETEEALAPLEAELSGMMPTAIQDLNASKLSDAAFQSFHTIWKVATDAVKERKAELAPPAPPALPPAAPALPEAKPKWSFANLLTAKSS